MARLNISLTNEMAKAIEAEAERLGKTVSSLVTEATAQSIKMHERGIGSGDLEELLQFMDLISSIRSVPVPFRMLDSIVTVAYESSPEKVRKIFFEQGKVLGNLLKTYANDLSELSVFANSMKPRLPIDDLYIRQNGRSTEIVISGAGYSKCSSECMTEALRGFLDPYDLKIHSFEILDGFVKAQVNSKD